MKVPLTVLDHIERAELVYGDRIGVVDEPDQPAASWGELTYRRIAELARAQAAGLDAPGCGPRRAGRGREPQLGPAAHLVLRGERVRAGARAGELPAHRRRGVVHRRALRRRRCCSSIPSSTSRSPGSPQPHRFVIGAESDEVLYRFEAEPAPWADRDEDATASINYTSGTTARPKGVQMTHRNLWLNAATFGWQLGISDRDVLPAHAADVPLQRLGHAVHGHRDGRSPHRAAQGRRRRDPAPDRRARRDRAVRRSCGRRRGARRGGALGRPDPRSRPRAHGGRRRAAAHPHDRAHRDRARAGSSSRSTASPRRRRCSP